MPAMQRPDFFLILGRVPSMSHFMLSAFVFISRCTFFIGRDASSNSSLTIKGHPIQRPAFFIRSSHWLPVHAVYLRVHVLARVCVQPCGIKCQVGVKRILQECVLGFFLLLHKSQNKQRGKTGWRAGSWGWRRREVMNKGARFFPSLSLSRSSPPTPVSLRCSRR